MAVTTPLQPDDDASLDLVFAALSDSTRRSIVSRLAEGDATVSELAEPFEMSLPGVSKHITVLERAGLVRRRRTGRARRCSLAPERMQAASAWIEARSAFWNETLDSLAAFVENRSEAAEDHS